ncbi:helix-turn-helix domain-containing protein [uncultured Adlercreutzia sp.]|uniref:helix-turn-helix domain-containing protein n=1 Tax=uncultured Adlercreutzia sp. TaxID=875803 RepID=UPI0026F3F10E|nr:AraC family transcriptional regulator [uncultured Adlercreutzia sp.]
MFDNIGAKLQPLFQPQLEALGMASEERRCGVVSRISPERGHGSAWMAGVGDDCLVTALDLTVNDATDLTNDHPGYFCVGTMSRTSLETMPVSVPDAGETALIAYQQQPGRFPYQLKAHGRYSSRSLCFTPAFFNRLIRDHAGSDEALARRLAQPLVADLPPRIGTMLARLAPEAADKAATSYHLAALMAETLALVVENAEEAADAEAATGSAASRRLAQQACDLMEQHLGEPLTIASIARELCVSRAHLAARFKEERGYGVAEHLRRVRMARACELLAGTDDTLGAIARAVGYPRQSSFTEAFKREFQATPTAWREAHRL